MRAAPAGTLRLPDGTGVLHPYTPGAEPPPAGQPAPHSHPFVARSVFAAAHVVADPLAATGPGDPAVLDWDATLAFRRHLWSHGLGVAEAMDTAQRGTGLDWPCATELIQRSAAEARAVGGRLVCGVGTDQLPAEGTALVQVRAAYEEQLAVAEQAGAPAALLASRALAACARGPGDYEWLYGELLRQTAEPVVLHWLGPMFDPALSGYWGSTDLDEATGTLLRIIGGQPDKVAGVKVSLLDAGREAALRRALPPGVRCYTGDDFHYPQLIAGDGDTHSDALLGVFDPLAPLAARALRGLEATGDSGEFRAALEPTVPLARQLFASPTRNYKTGVVLLAWLAGHQQHFTMVGGHQSARPLPHLARLYQLADEIGLFPDPQLAAHRMRQLLGVYGVPQ